MNKINRFFVTAVVLNAAFLGLLTGEGHAVCIPLPCPDCWIQSAGQLNLVVIDRDAGRVRLIPNIRVTGESAEFALIVPTPGLPELSEAPVGIWGEALALTQPTTRRRTSDGGGLGCAEDHFVVSAPENAGGVDGDDVVVHSEQTVGAFHATIVSSESPTALIEWLEMNNFPISREDSGRISPLIERGWFFTAMKLDTTQVGGQMPNGGWNADVEPVMFEYDADAFEVPLRFLSINRADWMPLVFFVLDDHRTKLAGFDTVYANDLSGSEFRSIEDLYPNLAAFLKAGRFFTRLDKTFTPTSPMNDSILLQRAANDDEFRRTWGIWFGSIWGSLPGQLLGLVLLLHLARAIGSAIRLRI